MTQPVQEPLTQRSVSGLTWDKNQLYRRPPPPSSTDIPWARIGRPYSEAVASITNNSFEDLPVTASWNTSAGESGELWFSVDLIDNSMTLLQPAYVIVHVEADWFSSINAPWAVWISQSESAFVTYNWFAGQTSQTMHGSLTLPCRADTGTEFTGGIIQLTTGPRDLNAGMMEISVLGTWSGDPWWLEDPDIP